MITHIDSQARPTARTLKTVVVVGNDPDERVLETVAEAGNYDVVCVEPTARAYSQIKRTAPSLVILCMDLDDLAACQVMSMLKLDRDTAGIPVVTCLVQPIPAGIQ